MLQMFSGDYEVARAQFTFLQKLEPENPDIQEWLAEALTLQGSYTEAIDILKGMDRQPAASAILCSAFARAGLRSDAVEIFNSLLEERTRTFVSSLHLAKCYTALDEPENAVIHLRRSAREPLFGTIKYSPWFEPLRTDLAFKQLLREHSAEGA